MCLQKDVLDRYLSSLGRKKTYREMADDLGMQVSRVFRIFNGGDMRLVEYEIFLRKIQERENKLITTFNLAHAQPAQHDAILDKIKEALSILRFQDLEDITFYLNRKFSHHALLIFAQKDI